MAGSVARRSAAVFLAVWLAIGAALAQAPDEQVLFDAAVRSLQLGAVERAEQEFAEFSKGFPTSPRMAEAILYRAQAAVRLGQYTEAIALLTTNTHKAGILVDRYRYWVGDSQFRSSNYVAAAETFASLIRDFPESSRLLAAAFGEAWAQFRLRQFDRTIDMLQDPEGAFQRAAYERRTDTLAIRGQLLLVEAYLEIGDTSGAERAAARLGDRTLTPELQWRRDYLLCRIALLKKNYPAALTLASNLNPMAAATDQAPLKAAEATALHGSILEHAQHPDAAIQVYTNNLAATVPPEYRRTAFLRIVELLLGQGRLTEAAQQLEQYFALYPREAGSDVALLTLGELQLRQYLLALEAGRTNSGLVAPTNYLYEALSRFERLRVNFPESPLLGQAHLHRGWCHWEHNNMVEAQAAFRMACEKLSLAEYLAVARFKLADTELRLGDYANAIDNYRRAIREARAVPTLNESLPAQALYQILRASLAMRAFAEAQDTMARLLQEHSEGLYGHRGLLLLSHGLIRAARPAEARAVLRDFAAQVKTSPFIAQVEFAIARSFAEETDWLAATRAYDEWIERHGTNALRPQVEFDRAWTHYLAEQEESALKLFTGFVAQFPTNALAGKAQFWIADYYLRHGNYTNAELHFQSARLANVHEARMMAGRAAFARHSYKDAYDYFLGLVNDDHCPADLAAEAFFALGDTTLLSAADGNSPIKRFDDAKEVFLRITHRYPRSRLVPLAWGQIGNCYFQMASVDANYYTNALEAYLRVLAPTNEAGITARSQAEFGIAQVLERQARLVPERPDLLKAALDYYLNIFNGKNLKANETADPNWVREAGFAGARLAEEQKRWELALSIYSALRDLAPASRDSLERRMARLRDQAAGEKS